jgi:hypothetical protein
VSTLIATSSSSRDRPRFAADVEDVRAGAHERHAVLDRRALSQVAAAVRETVGRHVDDTHHPGLDGGARDVIVRGEQRRERFGARHQCGERESRAAERRPAVVAKRQCAHALELAAFVRIEDLGPEGDLQPGDLVEPAHRTSERRFRSGRKRARDLAEDGVAREGDVHRRFTVRAITRARGRRCRANLPA